MNISTSHTTKRSGDLACAGVLRICPFLLLCALFLIAPARTSQADVVVLDNGESLSGTFSRIRENTLVFRTSTEGLMVTPVDRVKSVSASQLLYIALAGGRVYYGRLGVDMGQQVVFPIDGSAAVPIDVAGIGETLPIPTLPSGAVDRESMRLVGFPLPDAKRLDETLIAPELRFDASDQDRSLHSRSSSTQPARLSLRLYSDLSRYIAEKPNGPLTQHEEASPRHVSLVDPFAGRDAASGLELRHFPAWKNATHFGEASEEAAPDPVRLELRRRWESGH